MLPRSYTAGDVDVTVYSLQPTSQYFITRGIAARPDNGVSGCAMEKVGGYLCLNVEEKHIHIF